MTNELKHLGLGNTEDPITDIAIAIVAVQQINGKTPSDDEIRDGLVDDGLEPTDANIAKVRAAVTQIIAEQEK